MRSSSNIRIPIINTERLSMRGHRLSDFPECLSMWSDHEVVRYMGGKTFSEEAVWSKLHRYVGHWALLGFGYWVVEERTTGRFVGEVGLANFKRDNIASFGELPEIGWVLAPWAHGKGYATEAAGAALAWGQANLQPTATVCLIDTSHRASIRVAEKCGYMEYARTDYHGSQVALFRR